MDTTPKRVTFKVEDLAYSTMLQVEALVELLDEKGLLAQREVLERVKKQNALIIIYTPRPERSAVPSAAPTIADSVHFVEERPSAKRSVYRVRRRDM